MNQRPNLVAIHVLMEHAFVLFTEVIPQDMQVAIHVLMEHAFVQPQGAKRAR